MTKGTARTPLDVLLYGALLVILVVALGSGGTGPIDALGTSVGRYRQMAARLESH